MKLFRGMSYEDAINTPIRVVARQLEFESIVTMVQNEKEQKEMNDAKSRK